MRLIDADNISFYCNYEGDCTGDIDDCKECMNYICDFRDIQEHLTAYDIDKVVEELKLHSFEFGTDSIPAHYLRFNEAIEIVNQGGVSNDVCEWKFEETNGIAWHCDDKCTTYNQVYIKDLKIILEDFECKCPYCSKKIKVVE